MPGPPRRKLSIVRLLVLVLVVAGLGAAGWTQGSQAYRRITAKAPVTWFAPYDDVTLTPTYHFEDLVVSPSLAQVLGFVVAAPDNPCAPTWGTYYDLDGAGRALDLDRRITRLRERGGDVIISFGGAANSELASSCTDQAALDAAYASVVQRYDARTLDFDIEGTALADSAAIARRALAIATLQRRAAAAGHTLRVWLTLPVTPTGMPREAAALVSATLRGGAKLAGVNVMTMDYGGSKPAGQSMRAAGTLALRATARQLAAIYRRAGHPLTRRQLWAHIGATPMIGHNDIPGEVFSLSDARALVSFANRVGLGRVSMWSANRDAPCGVQPTDGGQVSNTCSGISQRLLGFTWELGRLNARMPGAARVSSKDEPVRALSRDDPATSPYPIWRPRKTYQLNDEVVWHERVYEAKWSTQGSLPDAPVAHLWDTPWRYIGPVLPSDAQTRPRTLRPWSADQVYLEGDRVLFEGSVFKAKWWTQANVPSAGLDHPGETPWALVGKAPSAQQPQVPVDAKPQLAVNETPKQKQKPAHPPKLRHRRA
jgi:chitinase